MRSEISHGGCHMVARKNGLSEGSYKLLIYLSFWIRFQDLSLRPSAYETVGPGITRWEMV